MCWSIVGWYGKGLICVLMFIKRCLFLRKLFSKCILIVCLYGKMRNMVSNGLIFCGIMFFLR